MADAATPSAPPLLFGRYRVQESLGETRLSAVYAAADERLQRRVLLHLLRKDLVGQQRAHDRFLAEIGQSARRSHQALLEVFDSGEAGSRPFMVTEHIAGRSLRSLGVLNLEQALLYMRQVAGAVATCQAQRTADLPAGLYHPPITSSNVLLVDEGRVKLAESWQLPIAEAPLELAHYRAPELSEGRPATPASAVYALGILLYELITGVRPVGGGDAHSVALAHRTARIPPLAQARPTLYLPAAERLIARATDRIPEQRYPDASAFGQALDALWRDLGASTQRLAPAPRRAAPARAPAPVAPRPAAPDPDAPPPRRPSGLTEISQRLTGRFARQPAVDPDQLRQGALIRGVIGWVVMVALVALVAFGAFVAADRIAARLGNFQFTPPGSVVLPTAAPGGIFGGIFGSSEPAEEIYTVNIAEGLNLRSTPDTSTNTNVITVIPNSTQVTKLEGPVPDGNNVNFLRVRVEIDGKTLEGWMSVNYLIKQ